jgi:predicted Zn finger-like uncharacterized protein
VIIECPACQAKYRFDEQRFEQKPSKKIRCARCREVFEVENPAMNPEPRTTGEFAAPNPAHSLTQETARDAEDLARIEDLPLQLPRGKRFSLAILTGEGAGDVFRIDKPRVTIGRSDADIPLEDTEASRLHAAIEIRDSICLLRDLGSTNGTLAGGERIARPVEMGDKSEFQIGNTTLMLIVTNEQ